ncbi:DUF421 domain-containing protein [Fictibacillus sp. KIGAM418]|uniref:DUF421 domain-containing protein n=1 Tax=Fictibacillus marinisediminis TaxID=2878389 RepID=A0A9X1XBW9_9BACL|nr:MULTISPECIES: DUF421 domain-containing protein [Fictibacillus]MCK6257886.1 DUF421 domain-containing protein [Fictibacillus marinisediminis]MED2972372.1 DUF421 domain-containing protein [Fictibacillus sp. B-59209]SFD62720.1 Uncharacterized membrane protein YcaP, DUF421 family [Bacillus sp. OV194]
MEYYTIILRTIFVYFILIGVFRLMGKREIGKLSVLDFVVSIMIAELAVISIEDPKVPMLKHLVGIFVLFLIQIFLAFLSLKSKKVREIVDGKPSIIIENGQINESEMKKQRYNFDDLLTQLRENNIKNVADVEFGILESTGKLSVITREVECDRKTNSAVSPLPLVFPVILDGKIQEDHLKKLDKTSLWLRQELRKMGIRDTKNISICTINNNDSLYVDKKDD